tara:strand:+ start:44 stop:493 length:450 start_codon:yes stop_codon:yes gene_type:complete
MKGFTLLELLIVIVVLGIALSFTSLSVSQNDHRQLLAETKRLASLLRLAREEAILRNTPISIQLSNKEYRFFSKNRQEWIPISRDNHFRKRQFPISNIIVRSNIPKDSDHRITIVFGHEPVAPPFDIFLETPNNQSSIRADGIGHFRIN